MKTKLMGALVAAALALAPAGAALATSVSPKEGGHVDLWVRLVPGLLLLHGKQISRFDRERRQPHLQVGVHRLWQKVDRRVVRLPVLKEELLLSRVLTSTQISAGGGGRSMVPTTRYLPCK